MHSLIQPRGRGQKRSRSRSKSGPHAPLRKTIPLDKLEESHSKKISIDSDTYDFKGSIGVKPPSDPRDFEDNALDIGIDGLVYVAITKESGKKSWVMVPIGEQATALGLLLSSIKAGKDKFFKPFTTGSKARTGIVPVYSAAAAAGGAARRRFV